MEVDRKLVVKKRLEQHTNSQLDLIYTYETLHHQQKNKYYILYKGACNIKQKKPLLNHKTNLNEYKIMQC